MKTIQRYEHDRLIIGEEGFTLTEWNALVNLNNLHENKYFEVLPKGIRFYQYVGVLQVDGLLIQINPKSDKNDTVERWQTVLLEMLKKCGHLKPDTVGDANVKRQNLNLLEVYFEYFLREIDRLIRQGLIKKYRKETSNIYAFKGKLEFAGNIRHNLVHQERFYTTHQVYDFNHKLNQILNFALDIVKQFTSGTHLNDLCRRVSLAYPETDKFKVNAKILDGIKFDRKNAPYERAFELARLIILNYSPDINQGSNKMIALLFDMNVLWEEYVLKMLKIEIEKSNYEIQIIGQDSKPFWGYNRLKPDIVLKTKEKTYIIDTKWKRPGERASMEDLRQVYAYARFWDADEVMLLYPGDSADGRSGFYLTDDYSVDRESNELKNIKHQAKMGFVSVLNPNGTGLDLEIGKEILKVVGII